MEPSTDDAPLIVIVGPTASGKSSLALQLAEKLNGEIIAADSRTIYRGMDVGTAKPSAADRVRVPHHLLDIVSPDEPFTVADFKTRALACIDEITVRGKVPLMVGGTGLYVDAILFDFALRPAADPAVRAALQRLSVDELQARLAEARIALPENVRNPRHLIRRLETAGVTAAARPLRRSTLVVGLDVPRDVLKMRIKERVASMLQAGLESEARHLSEQYGWDRKALQTIGYREFEPYFKGVQTLAVTEAKIVQDTNAYAKRQRTWFARNKSIHWMSHQKEIEDLITTFLSK